MGKDLNYDVFLRGEELRYEHLKEGHLVFFQRPLSCGGGFWLVRTYRHFFEYVIGYPISLSQGIEVIIMPAGQRSYRHEVEDCDDFQLLNPPSN